MQVWDHFLTICHLRDPSHYSSITIFIISFQLWKQKDLPVERYFWFHLWGLVLNLSECEIREEPRGRICKPFKEPMESTPSLAGPCNNPIWPTGMPGYIILHRLAESIPGFLKRIQIPAQLIWPSSAMPYWYSLSALISILLPKSKAYRQSTPSCRKNSQGKT
jgi:hypothetical protein